MTQLAAGDILYLFHGTAARDAKDRPMLCVHAVDGMFLIISRSPPRNSGLPLPKALNPYLKEDSFIHLDAYPIEIYDGEIEEAMLRDGIAGRVDSQTMAALIDLIRASGRISPRTKAKLLEGLGAS